MRSSSPFLSACIVFGLIIAGKAGGSKRRQGCSGTRNIIARIGPAPDETQATSSSSSSLSWSSSLPELPLHNHNHAAGGCEGTSAEKAPKKKKGGRAKGPDASCDRYSTLMRNKWFPRFVYDMDEQEQDKIDEEYNLDERVEQALKWIKTVNGVQHFMIIYFFPQRRIQGILRRG